MEEFREQYSQELAYQEIRANKYTLQGFIWFLAAEALVWLLNITGFFEVDKKLLTVTFTLSLVLLIPALYIRLKGNLTESWVKYLLLLLICVEAGVIVSFLSFHATLLYVMPLLLAVQYREKRALWFSWGVNTVTMLISSLVSFYYGLCDLNVLLQSQHKRSWYLHTITDSGLHILYNENPVFVIVAFEVLPRTIILLLFAIILQYTMISSGEDALRIARLTYLKEMDAKTKVFNKNKYEEMAEEYYPKISRIGVAFWDLNNLKYINDRYGHMMGDKAIEKLSNALDHYSSDRHRVYRIGGDEFLLVIDNPMPGETEHITQEARKDLEAEKKDIPVRISSAVGIAFGKGTEIRKVVEAADTHMYEDKRNSRDENKYGERKKNSEP